MFLGSQFRTFLAAVVYVVVYSACQEHRRGTEGVMMSAFAKSLFNALPRIAGGGVGYKLIHNSCILLPDAYPNQGD